MSFSMKSWKTSLVLNTIDDTILAGDIDIKCGIFQDRNFPNMLSEMRRVFEESQRFPQQDVPPRQHEKERVIRAYQDIERTLRDSGESLDRDLMPESLDRNWNQMMMLHQERHQIIQEEIAR